MPDIDFVYFDAGGGHRSAATALKAVCQAQGRDWNIRLVNLQEVLDSLDIFRKLFRVRLEDLYNRMLAKGWTLGSEYLLRGIHLLIRLYHPAQVRVLTRYWFQTRPDMVVSLVPNFNRAMFQALSKAVPGAPYVTVITDIADFPPRFWMEPQDQFIVCGSERAVEQAHAMKYRPERIFKTSGMVLRPAFYQKFEGDRTVELTKLGLDPARRTGLMLFGGQGSAVMGKIAGALNGCRTPVQLIAICGRNARLASRLRSLQTSYPLHVVDFTSEIPFFMSLADFFIGKPGPGSVSEAIAMQLPVIIERNAWTLPQERYNADWVRETGTGIVVRDFKHIADAVDQLLAEPGFTRYRSNVSRIRNNAVFEIPDILANILEQQRR